ncbi:MAG: ATP-binding protein [Gammaproteobacteria bacterium]
MIGARFVFERRYEHWLLAAMLLVLHAALDAGLESALSAALMLAHLGLFFLWQPIWQKDQRLEPAGIALLAVIVVVMIATLSWWSIFAWLVLLIGIVAGRPFLTRRERYVYMFSLTFLVSELLIDAAAMLFFEKPLAAPIARPFQVGLYLLPLALFAVPPTPVPQRAPLVVDFFRGITFALVTALMAVFSALMTFRVGVDYTVALVISLMSLGLFLLFLAWLVTPGAGSIGLLAMWEKSVLNIGTPFEAWLGNVANLAAQRERADDFLVAAIEELNDIPWIAGVEWATDEASGQEGQQTNHRTAVDTETLRVTLYSVRGFSTALLIHSRLLVQVLGHFYTAKLRENAEAEEAHMRAVYETGARITHDIKNLLQSLNTMAGALADATTAEQESRGFNLLRRRLPDIARRLRLALDKLQRPAEDASEWIEAGAWWEVVRARFDGGAVLLDAELDRPEARLPGDCFDSVIENLVDNARQKVAAGDASQVRVRLEARAEGVVASVTDDGRAIDADTAERLFRAPVSSGSGLGIGLYQAAKHAHQSGCDLRLAENRDGVVTFALACRERRGGARVE